MRILLFGKNGQVARCFREEASGRCDVTALGSADVDLSQPNTAVGAIEKHAPDIIINAAAYTAVDRAEEEKDAAARINTLAVKDMARTAKTIGAHFIHISTDYVFDGADSNHYHEKDTANPLSVYGKTKHEGELAALKAYNQTIILRTSWVFSEYGGNFVKTMLRLAGERDALTIVDDQIGGPTPARDIAHAILMIAEKKQRGAPGQGIYHYQGAPAVSWAGFARKIFEYADKNISVTPIATSDYPTPAARPLHTILDCARIERTFGISQPDWRIGLRQVIDALKKKDDLS
jgi:dTDP-4-dehydrorhamnose reductase